MTCGIGPVPVSGSGLVLGLIRTHENRRRFQNWNRRLRSGSRPSHLNVVLSKAALSGPSVCLRARAPCPLRVSCLRIARERTALAFPAGADHRIASSVQRSCRFWRSGGSSSLGQDKLRVSGDRVRHEANWLGAHRCKTYERHKNCFSTFLRGML